uniref:Chromodomain Y like n=1 Tax=Sus scrofa TaxID=9823 RepID=A0A8D1FV95_PIG
MDVLTANGPTSLQPSVTGVTAGKRKFIDDRRDQPFDKRLRFSVRQTESAYRYRDIVVRKQDGFTHILLSTKSSENNSLNPEVMKEVQSALSTAAADDSKLVLLSAVGSVFCCGLDFIYFIRRLTDDRKRESTKMAEAIRNFVNTFIQFKKPIIVAVNGPAIGLGASILPLCDVVWANEKAWFQTPYTTFGQSPDGCSTVMFPKIMGGASVSTASSHTTPSAARGRLARLLLCGRARCRSPSGEFASGAEGVQLVLMNSRSNPRGHRGASGLVHGLCGDAALPHSREGAPSLCHSHREPPGEKPSSYPKK